MLEERWGGLVIGLLRSLRTLREVNSVYSDESVGLGLPHEKRNLSKRTYPEKNHLVTRYTVTNAFDLLLRSRLNVSFRLHCPAAYLYLRPFPLKPTCVCSRKTDVTNRSKIVEQLVAHTYNSITEMFRTGDCFNRQCRRDTPITESYPSRPVSVHPAFFPTTVFTLQVQ